MSSVWESLVLDGFSTFTWTWHISHNPHAIALCPSEACQSYSLSLPFCFLFLVFLWLAETGKYDNVVHPPPKWSQRQLKHGWVVWAPPPPVPFTPYGMFWLRGARRPTTRRTRRCAGGDRRFRTAVKRLNAARGRCHVAFSQDSQRSRRGSWQTSTDIRMYRFLKGFVQ